ncbi:hypothetical protein [Sedimenticola hydrogenitrophicus]|uniref:hypothetical protein n=1 Tax=Sedimenticola hydrogenitrophicus TaxID=2967975 RepID=UPI0023AEFEEC|nr:hypothetical protein [Sedimenticola hydrogenitrophicus]
MKITPLTDEEVETVIGTGGSVAAFANQRLGLGPHRHDTELDRFIAQHAVYRPQPIQAPQRSSLGALAVLANKEM